jgi:hypothetical protein
MEGASRLHWFDRAAEGFVISFVIFFWMASFTADAWAALTAGSGMPAMMGASPGRLNVTVAPG